MKAKQEAATVTEIVEVGFVLHPRRFLCSNNSPRMAMKEPLWER